MSAQREKIFRQLRLRLQEAKKSDPGQTTRLNELEQDLIRLYYTGKFEAYARKIAEVPGR